MVVSALAVEDVLNLGGTEFYVFKNGLIGMKRPNNAIVTKVDNSLGMFFQGGNKIIRVCVVLENFRLHFFNKGWQLTVGSAMMAAARDATTNAPE